jgi:hypothetical protein
MTTKNRTYRDAARLTTIAALAFAMGALVASPARIAGPDNERAGASVTESRPQTAVEPTAGTQTPAADDGQVFEYH